MIRAIVAFLMMINLILIEINMLVNHSFIKIHYQVFLRNYIIFVSIGVKLTEPAGSESLFLTHDCRESRM